MIDIEEEANKYACGDIDLQEAFLAGAKLVNNHYPSRESFAKITDLRFYLNFHPDSEMVRGACLHFLGDKAQEWYYETYLKDK